jgi:uncharacterized membrane protein YqjE
MEQPSLPARGHHAPNTPTNGTAEDPPPVAELVQQLSDQTTTLIRQELRLAQVELQEKGKRAGIGAGLFGGAGLVALYGVGFVLAAAALLLATALEPWIAALIVGASLLALAGVLALTGKQQVEQATPLTPEQAIETTKQDVDELKERTKR